MKICECTQPDPNENGIRSIQGETVAKTTIGMKLLILANIRTTQDQIQPIHPVLYKLTKDQIDLLTSIINAIVKIHEFTQVEIYRSYLVCKSLP